MTARVRVASVLLAGGLVSLAGAGIAHATPVASKTITVDWLMPVYATTASWPQTYTAQLPVCGHVAVQEDTYNYTSPEDVAAVDALIAHGTLNAPGSTSWTDTSVVVAAKFIEVDTPCASTSPSGSDSPTPTTSASPTPSDSSTSSSPSTTPPPSSSASTPSSTEATPTPSLHETAATSVAATGTSLAPITADASSQPPTATELASTGAAGGDLAVLAALGGVTSTAGFALIIASRRRGRRAL